MRCNFVDTDRLNRLVRFIIVQKVTVYKRYIRLQSKYLFFHYKVRDERPRQGDNNLIKH